MATALSIALRRQAALDRIAASLGVDTTIQVKDEALREVVLLERIAEALPPVSQVARDEAADKPKRTKKAATNDD